MFAVPSNLGGKVIPVVDLRLKFGLPEADYGPRTSIIVVTVRQLVIGVVMDGATEVLTLTDADIENTPDFGEGMTNRYMLV